MAIVVVISEMFVVNVYIRSVYIYLEPVHVEPVKPSEPDACYTHYSLMI